MIKFESGQLKRVLCCKTVKLTRRFKLSFWRNGDKVACILKYKNYTAQKSRMDIKKQETLSQTVDRIWSVYHGVLFKFSITRRFVGKTIRRMVCLHHSPRKRWTNELLRKQRRVRVERRSRLYRQTKRLRRCQGSWRYRRWRYARAERLCPS